MKNKRKILFYVLGISFIVLIVVGVIFSKMKSIDSNKTEYRVEINKYDLLAVADAKKGKELVSSCEACHSFNKGEAHKFGPNLFGVVGRNIAGLQDYSYSPNLSQLKDQVWTVEALNKWITDPSLIAPNTKMLFDGQSDPQNRMDIIAYLISLK